MCEFEKRVVKAFKNSNFSSLLEKKSRIGAAVSGGADSVSLLFALSAIFGSKNVFVITVNHNIRAFEESMGDCLFVKELCTKLGAACSIVELPIGEIEKKEQARDGGTEEAARYLRYKAFENFIEENNLECLCLAHNLNDQLETLLMRFLQGSGVEGGGGIVSERGKIFRPLLEIERKDIEDYLSFLKVPFRTDSTNSDDSYLRNNIRNNLVPLLDLKFSGWKKSILAGREKAFEDESTLSEIADKISWRLAENEWAVADYSSICNTDYGIFRRSVYNGLKKLKIRLRLSHGFLRELYERIRQREDFFLEFSGEIFEKTGNDFFIKKNGISKTEASFFCIIEEDCEKFEIPSCKVEIETDKDGIILRSKIIQKKLKVICKFPCVVRSFVPGDKVLDSEGKLREVNKILKNWHVTEDCRKLVPVVEECGEESRIVAVAGSLSGYSDWIVKGNI